tara:strand:- start:7524 stop:7799 length:276 start_codon:yes stop_codon:yes gene_type:complete
VNISLIKWIVDFIIKAIEKKYDLKKIKDYVEKPNELDKKVQEIENTVFVFNKSFDNVEDTLKDLKKEAHPPIFSKLNLDKIEKRIAKLEKR